MTQNTETVEKTSLPAENAASSSANRRGSNRFACDGVAEVLVLGGALRLKGRIQNLSCTGCYVATDSKFGLERGTQVEILLEVNRTQFRVGGGVRVWHRGTGVGLEFSHVSTRCFRSIQQLIVELDTRSRQYIPDHIPDPISNQRASA